MGRLTAPEECGDRSEQSLNGHMDFSNRLAEIEEEFQCAVCLDLIVLPTTLNCGHSFCRHCLALWFDCGKRTECPSCQQAFLGMPMVNIQMKSTLEKLFRSRYSERTAEVMDEKENKTAIDEFESILKKRQSDDEFSAASTGCLIGTALAFIIISCLYLAVHWGSSEIDLLVKKPLVRWSVDDVSNWLLDLGLEDYQANFEHQKVNGRMLSEINGTHLETMLGMNNGLHQKMVLQALNYTKEHGVKQPTNLWEFKAVYNWYTSFMLYAMGHSPRIAMVYLYAYDEHGFAFYKNTLMSCDRNMTGNNTFSSWGYVGMILFPNYANGKFSRCFTDLHYWTSRFIILSCTFRFVLEIMNILWAIQNPSEIDIGGTLVESAIVVGIYYVVGSIWWLIPTIIRDALFYAEVYFSPAFYFRDICNGVFRS